MSRTADEEMTDRVEGVLAARGVVRETALWWVTKERFVCEARDRESGEKVLVSYDAERDAVTVWLASEETAVSRGRTTMRQEWSGSKRRERKVR